MAKLRNAFTRAVSAAVLFSSIGAGAASSQSLFDGNCPSGPIIRRFVEFGKTGQMPKDLGKWLNTPEDQNVEPWKPFDNVDFVGVCWVSAWLIHTDDGAVLIDTLYGPFRRMIVAQIQETGTDLADIKYVLMTHGHFDHVGGAVALKPLLPNATFVMTQKGWDEAVASSAQSQGGRREWDMIEPEMVVADGDEITLGNSTFTGMETPGHTWGTASYIYDVMDGDKTHRAITIGGLGLNAIEGPSQVEAYIDSVDRIRAMAEDADTPIEVHLTTHGFSAGLDENRLKHMERASGEPNVFVDPQALLNQVAGLRDRAVKRLALEKNK